VTTRLDHLSAPRPHAARVGIVAAWALTCVTVAWLDTRYGAKAVAGTTAAVALLLLVRARAFGVLLGLALVGCLNGFPGVDVDPGGNSISHTQDVFALAIIGGSLYVAASRRVQRRSHVQHALYVVCALLFIWWTITWARTVIFGVVPASLAARFARDFAYFAITLPLLCDVFVTYPRLRRQLLWTMGVFASQTHVDLNFILHSGLLTNVDGTTRVYSAMTMLVRAAFPLSLGALIVGPTPRVRRWAIAPTVLFGISMVLQLTRAAYFGAAAGFLVAGAIWWFRRSSERNVARKQLILVPILLAFLIGATSAVSAGERDLISKVATRAFAGYSDVSNTSGTVAVRTHVANEMLSVLGGQWPVGLGFQHPGAHPYPSLPNGSIRDSDLGVLNAVMLMGVVGAILVYLPLVVVLRALTRRSEGSRAGPGVEWLRLGATIWIIAVAASSITLIELFSFGGLELSATMLALAASVSIPRAASSAARA
jgi:hypothetical protein